MALKIVYGRSGSGKTSFCFETISENLKNGEKVVYMVPEQFSLESERRIASRFSASATSLVEVLSFERLAHKVFSQYGPLFKEYINDAGRKMLVQKAILSVEGKLTILLDAAKQLSFADDIIGIISEFKRHNILSSDLSDMAQKVENPALKLKLEDLSLIYKAYCDGIDKSWCDEQDSLNILCDRIEKFKLFSDTHFIIDQFTSFTPQEYKVIESLLKHSRQVTVTITTDRLEKGSDKGIDVFSEPKDTADRLFCIAVDNSIEILPNTYVGECKKYKNNQELAHLEENYFKYPNKLYEKPTENIVVYEANNYCGEVEAAAKKVLKLTREQKLRFRDIVVAARNEDVYFPLIRHTFAQYKIPCFVSDKKPATKHPLSQLIISLLNILIYNWDSNYIMQYLKLGFSDLEEDDIFLLENYVLASGLNYSQWVDKKDLAFIPQGFEEEDIKRINKARINATLPILELKNKLAGRKKVKDIIHSLYSFLIENKVDEKLQSRIEAFLKQGDLEEAKQWQLSWDMLMNTFDQLIEILGENYITFKKFSSIFVSGLSCYNLAQVPPMVDQVQVVSIDEHQNHGAKVLMVLGTTEGIFPKGYLHEGILSDADRIELREKGLQTAKDTISKQLSEQYLIYRCISAPTDKLYFFYPIADNEGKACNPSPIIGRILKLFPNLKIKNNIFSSDDLDEIEGAKPLFWQMIAKLANNQPLNEKWEALLLWYKENWNEMIEYAKNAISYTNLPKRLSQESRDILFGKTPYTSISRIEGYSRCQFAYFIQYGLAVLPRKEYKLKDVDVGSLMHFIIEQFSLDVQQHKGGWKELDKEYAYKKVDKLCEIALTEYLGDEQLRKARFNQLLLKLKRIMRVTAWNIAQFYKNSDFQPLGYELEFGRGDMPALEIELKDGLKVRLVGKIDRVDVCRSKEGNYISVVDYKSSGKNMDYSYISAGIQLQLPAYIDAICKALSEKEKTTYLKGAMLYYKIDAPIIDASLNMDEKDIWDATVKQLRMRGIISEQVKNDICLVASSNSAIEAEKIDWLCRFTIKKIQKVMEEMLSGNIKINPYRSGNEMACEYCPYSSVCKFDTDFAGNHYRNIRKMKKEEFFKYADKMD